MDASDGFTQASAEGRHPEPGMSMSTPKEKELIKNMRHLDKVVDFRESVHGSQLAQSHVSSHPLSISMDVVKSLGKIAMPPVNMVAANQKAYHN